MKKLLGNVALYMAGISVLVGLLMLMEWVDPWWSTGYNASPLSEQIGALTFWAFLGGVCSLPFLAGTGRLDFLGNPALSTMALNLVYIPLAFVCGGLFMLIVLIDSSVWLATGMACVVTVLVILCMPMLERARRRFLGEG